MDAAKRETYKLPIAWIDRIFARLTDIYGERFTGKFSKPEYMDMEKLRWSGGLYGLNGDQIKNVLNLCLNNKIKEPPNVVEFFHYAKEWKAPAPEKPPVQSASPETQAHYMKLIREKLNAKGITCNAGLSDQHKPSVEKNSETYLSQS